MYLYVYVQLIYRHTYTYQLKSSVNMQHGGKFGPSFNEIALLRYNLHTMILPHHKIYPFKIQFFDSQAPHIK